MKFESVDTNQEPFSVTFRPSLTGGRFIVRTAQGSDFVGDKAVVFGISKQDADALDAGDDTPLTKYLKPDGQNNGTVRATDLVVGIDVEESRTYTSAIGVTEFQEFIPYTDR